ncbi:hypothetical protein SSPS47_02955 [Streptomyces sp. S4.7]|nr:hypothetical protein [Streptomyces sp. S4.7]QHY94086.1 hypothetical protein SSPS47_02955 [Streptomyces sp. S4.7]
MTSRQVLAHALADRPDLVREQLPDLRGESRRSRDGPIAPV